MQLWGELIAAHQWITGPVFVAGVYDIAWNHKGGFLPEPATALDFFEAARSKIDREVEARAVAALPVPELPETPKVEPTDPYSSTPQERERWAKEDAFIRPWAARLGLYDVDSQRRPTPRFPVTPQLFEMMSGEERQALIDQHQRDVSVSQWPNLKPIERRAKEARIAAERAAAPALQEVAAQQYRERRAAFLSSLSAEEAKAVGGRNPAVEVRWKDGEVSRVELTPPAPRHQPEQTRKEAAKAKRDLAPPDWYECLCGDSVFKYADGSVKDAFDLRPHFCTIVRPKVAR